MAEISVPDENKDVSKKEKQSIKRTNSLDAKIETLDYHYTHRLVKTIYLTREISAPCQTHRSYHGI
jgi:hypothetical protein